MTQCGSGCGGSSCSPALCTANAQCGSGQVCEDGACVVQGSSHASETAAGCGCSTPGTSRSPAWLLFLVAAAAVLLRRRHGEDRAARG
ncbi:MAG: MYXO-CTERM sorting domain-containing protein [Polyangiaceae bacterium]|nr:MYXO-CTERM sorting domain-containing protein [Polyangiaceae bacterium]